MLLVTMCPTSTSAGSFENAPRQTRPPRFSMWMASLTALRAPEHQVDAEPIGQPPYRVDDRLRRRVEDDVGADAPADREAAVDDVGEDHGAGSERLAH